MWPLLAVLPMHRGWCEGARWHSFGLFCSLIGGPGGLSLFEPAFSSALQPWDWLWSSPSLCALLASGPAARFRAFRAGGVVLFIFTCPFKKGSFNFYSVIPILGNLNMWEKFWNDSLSSLFFFLISQKLGICKMSTISTACCCSAVIDFMFLFLCSTCL